MKKILTDYRIALPLAANLLRDLTGAEDVVTWRRVHASADKSNPEFMQGKDLASLLALHTPMHGADPASIHGLIKGLLKATLPSNMNTVYEHLGTRDKPFQLRLADTAQQTQLWEVLRVGYWIKIQSRTPAGNLVGEPFWTRLLEWEHVSPREQKPALLRAMYTQDIRNMCTPVWRLPSNYQLQGWMPVMTDFDNPDKNEHPLNELLE